VGESVKRDQSSLGRLWAEFTDPGPAGDAPVFLAKYAGGFAPGCMGFVCMAVGIFIMTLLARQAAAERKAWLVITFGAVFALAGFAALRAGLSTVLSKAAEPREGEDGAPPTR
jgi:hypothetical protein